MRNSLGAISGFLLLLLIESPALAAEQAPLALDHLPQIITGAPDHRAVFVEERRLQLLTKPVRLEGTLRFKAPDHFEKHTESPQREDLVIDGEWATIDLPDHNNRMRFNITDDPTLYGLFFSLQAVLNGEPGRLGRLFAVEAWGGASAWTLRLKPTGTAMAERIQVVRVTGESYWIRTIELWETSGDYLIMTIGSETTE